MTENGTLSPKQHALLLAMLQGERVEQAAKTAKVSPRTAYRWQQETAFQQAMREEQRKAFEKTLQSLMTGTSTALRVLLETMTDKKAPYSVRVAAARTWLENALTLYKLEDIEARLASIENGGPS